MMLLEIEQLRAGYDGLTVLWDVDLTLSEGQVVTLLGPNGAGKTTLLLAILGLVEAHSGTIAISGLTGHSRGTYRIARSGVSLIPDDRGLIPTLTVQENLQLVRPWRRDPIEIFPELTPLRKRQAGLLSGGEQQMLALARAFASEPRLLLIDELSQGLAPVLVQRLMPQVRKAADEWGAGVLLVEQDVRDALRVADLAYVLSSGRMMVSAMPADSLLSQPELLQAAYLGDGAARHQAKDGGELE